MWLLYGFRGKPASVRRRGPHLIPSEEPSESRHSQRQGLHQGTRITVYDVLEYVTGGMTEEEILRDFPDLTREDIRATLAFAAARERRLANAVG
jgi:uncharacterized protein DUF433